MTEDIKELDKQIRELKRTKAELIAERKKKNSAENKSKKIQAMLNKIVPEGFSSLIEDDVNEILTSLDAFYYMNNFGEDKAWETSALVDFLDGKIKKEKEYHEELRRAEDKLIDALEKLKKKIKGTK
jgi:DNA repair exonuclease SbcCD ATPase subunit